MKNRTKQLFADTLEEMLVEMPLEKIRVNDLCERCGERRQVFYYHFQDKYALVAWMYDRDLRNIKAIPDDLTYQAFVTSMMKNLWERRDFYRKAFADKSQNSIEWHIHNSNLEESEHVLRTHLSVKEVSAEQKHAIMFHSFGSVNTVIEWLRGNLAATPSELAAWHCQRMPAFLKQAHEREAIARHMPKK